MGNLEQFHRLPNVLSVQKIWDKAEHNAFTDLVYYHDTWFCTFREADLHEKGSPGAIRIIRSPDGKGWEPCAFFSMTPYDLRDPKLTPTPDGRLMLLIGSITSDAEHKYLTRESLVSFSFDGLKWDPLQPVLRPHDWLWRVTWSRGIAYGVSYRFSNIDNLKEEWLVSLWRSKDGLQYDEICLWEIKGRPNETTLRVMPSGEMIALVRRNQRGMRHDLIGTSWPPYDRWKWAEANIHLGGPNFIIADENTMWASGRMMFFTPYAYTFKTVLARMTRTSLQPVLTLPSDGDTSYPGMVLLGNQLWLSYFSSHEDKTSVYVAIVKM